MSNDIEKFIRIQNQHRLPGKESGEWRTIPNGMRVRVWDMSTADAVAGEEKDAGGSTKRYIFHIAHMPHVARGSRVSYLGQQLAVLSVSDSTKLLGLELRCAPGSAKV
ncbi:MAG: hypothetical protein ABL879_10410 [Devosia sp.]